LLAAVAIGPVATKAFVHGIIINVDGVNYYLAGAPDGPGGATDIPGHYWTQASPNQLGGKHYDEAHFGAAQCWSSSPMTEKGPGSISIPPLFILS
jgi:hypothetical protein